MARYAITSPDGARYKVEAPDDASEADVLAYAQAQAAGQKPSTTRGLFDDIPADPTTLADRRPVELADMGRVKRNIGRMIDQDAPESDIDAYLATEGVTAAQLRADRWPVFSIETPGKRVIDIEADDEATALRGAREWDAANPAGSQSTTLSDFRARYPAYRDMPDGELATALHAKFYSDMPRQDFNAKIGFAPTAGLFDDLVPEAKPKKQAELRAYEPSIRDRIGQFLMPDERASPLREKAVEMVVGSRGLGKTGTISLADLNPITGPILAGDEAARAAAKGDIVEAGISALGVIPAPGVKDIMARTATQATQAATAAAPRAAPATGRLNPDLPAREQIAQAAAAEGIKVPFAAATDSRALQQIGGAVADVPFAGKPLVDRSKAALDAIERRAGEVRDAFSGSPASAGDTFRDAARAWSDDDAKAVAQRLFDGVESRMTPSAIFPLSRTRVEAGKITAEMIESAGQSAKGTLSRIQGALQRPGMTFRGMRGLRSEVGELLTKSISDTNLSQGALKRIYGALTEDMQFAISRPKTKGGGGQKGLVAWQRANNLYAQIKERQKILADIIGERADAPAGSIVERIKTLAGSKGGSDINRLVAARKAVGTKAWDSVSANLVQQMGDTKNGFSIAQFRTAYMKLSEEGRTALFSSTGKDELKTSLDRLSVIGQGAERLQRFANASNSGRLGTIVAGGATLGLGWISPIALVALIGGMAHGYVAARVLARPVAARALADAGEAAMKALAANNPTGVKQYELLLAQFLRVAGPEIAGELLGGEAAPGGAQ